MRRGKLHFGWTWRDSSFRCCGKECEMFFKDGDLLLIVTPLFVLRMFDSRWLVGIPCLEYQVPWNVNGV